MLSIFETCNKWPFHNGRVMEVRSHIFQKRSQFLIFSTFRFIAEEVPNGASQPWWPYFSDIFSVAGQVVVVSLLHSMCRRCVESEPPSTE